MKKILFLLLTAVCAMLYAPPASAWTVYLDPANTSGFTPTAYVWAGSDKLNGNFPGYSMTKDEYGRWKASGTGTPTNVIFTKGDSNKTKLFDGDPVFNDGYTYTWNGTAGSTPTSSKWTEYTVYFDATNPTWAQLYLQLTSPSTVSPVDMKTYMVGKDSAKGTNVSGKIYKFTFASSSDPTGIFYAGYNSGWNNEQTFSVTGIKNGHIYKASSQWTGSDADNSKWQVTDNGVYNPVSVTSVELWKDGVKFASDNAAPYTFSLSGLKGTEKFLVKVNYDDNSLKSYTVSSGTNLTETSSTTGFSIDSKIIDTVMTVNVSGTDATSYSTTATNSDAITSVTLDGASSVTKTAAPYTFTNVAVNPSGYTVLVKTKRNTTGVTYSFDNANAGTGTYTLIEGREQPFGVSEQLTSFNATVAVNSSTLKATTITISDPNAVITGVKLVRRDNGQTITLTSKDGGKTWTWHGTSIKTYTGAGSTNDRSYQLVVNNAGTEQKWYYNSDDYGFESENTYATGSDWKTTTGTERFRFKGDDDKDYKITVVLTADKKGIASLKYEGYSGPAAGAYMPLKEEDFADGPRYFIVGQRTADWCLQPEWELHVSGNQATLSGRFMYQGYFGIAKVDNYDDYLMQRYTLYYNKTDVNACKGSFTGSQTITLTNSQSSGAVDYKDENKYVHNGNNSIRWQATAHYYWTNNDDPNNGDWNTGGSGTDFDAQSLKVSKPALLKEVRLTLDNGIPKSVYFNYDYSTETIAANKSMTLIGSDIRYVGDYDFGGDLGKKNLDEMGRAWVGDKQKVTGWANSWIQSDKNGRPYVDGRGNTVYLTAYDKKWLANHTTVFYNQAKDLIYDSESVTFLPPTSYDDYEVDTYKWLYTAHPTYSSNIGGGTSISLNNESETYRYKEVFPNDYGTTTDAINNSGWQCLVVKDMWLQGAFKVWSGGGGNLKTGWDGVDYGGAKDAFQWCFENGGHGIGGQQKEVYGYDLTTANGGNVTLYPTLRDVNAADFSTAKSNSQAQMKFYSRVVLWYNPSTSFKNSVLQFVEPVCEPVIQARYNTAKRKTLRYNWWINIPDKDTSHDSKMVTDYKVYRLNPDGSETLVETGNANRTVGEMKTEETSLSFSDPQTLTPGKYRYRVEATIEGKVKKQLSNELPINETRVPVTIAARQQMFDNDGNLNNAEGTNYSFNVELDVEPVAAFLDDKVGETEKTVRETMKYYVITVDDATATRLNSATVKPFTFTSSTTDEVLIATGEYLPAGTWYFKQEITDKQNPAISPVWKNVAPTAADANGTALKTWNADKTALVEMADNDVANYAFKVYLISEEGDIPQWTILQFDAATDQTHVIAPVTSLTVNNVTLAKVTRSVTHTHKNNMTHPSGARLNGFKADSEGNLTLDEDNPVIALPVKYQRFNETVAPATISALPVVGDVTKEGVFGVNYRLYLMPATTAIDGNYANSKFNTDINGVNDNARNDVSLNLYDVDLSQVESNPDMLENAIDGGKGKRIKADTELQFDSHILVEYTKGDKTYVNPYGEASSEISFTANMAAPDVSTRKAMYRVYEDFYYHMSPKELEEANKDDDWPGKPAGKISVGHYAHAVVDMNYSVESELESYAAFHVQQKALYDGSHKGVYGHTVDRLNNHASYIHKFAGTRSANGGQPLCYDATGNAGNDNVFINRHNDGGDTNYEIHSWGKDDNWTTAWADRHDWSTMAAKSRRLPIEINPAASYGATAPAAGSSKPANITGTFAAVYPVIKGSGLRYLINGAQAAAAKAEAENEAVDLYLFQAKAESDVDFSDAKEITTGVEDIMADQINGDTEFYNLQGIRVMNPAKGQIYIVRQGDRVSKMLYR